MVSSEVQKHPGGSSPRTLTSCISQTSKTEMGGLAHFLALILYQRIFNEWQSISLSRRCMMNWLLPPSHSSLLPSVSWTHRKTEKERQRADGRWGEGRGKEPNHTRARKPDTHIKYSLFYRQELHPQPDIERGVYRLSPVTKFFLKILKRLSRSTLCFSVVTSAYKYLHNAHCCCQKKICYIEDNKKSAPFKVISQPQSTELTRGPPELVRHFCWQWASHRSRTLLDKNLKWFGYIARLSQREEGGYFTSSNNFYLFFCG